LLRCCLILSKYHAIAHVLGPALPLYTAASHMTKSCWSTCRLSSRPFRGCHCYDRWLLWYHYHCCLYLFDKFPGRSSITARRAAFYMCFIYIVNASILSQLSSLCQLDLLRFLPCHCAVDDLDRDFSVSRHHYLDSPTGIAVLIQKPKFWQYSPMTGASRKYTITMIGSFLCLVDQVVNVLRPLRELKNPKKKLLRQGRQ